MTKSGVKRDEVRRGLLQAMVWLLFSFWNSEESNNSKLNPAFQIIMRAYGVDIDRKREVLPTASFLD